MERAAPATVHGDQHLTLVSEAEAYLQQVAGRCQADGVETDRHAHPNEVGDVARCAVDHAAEMAADLVVVTTHLMPTATAVSLDLEETNARRALEELAAMLRAEGLPASALVSRGSPAQGLLGHAVQAGADMIAMATHGRIGLDAVFSGSVAPRIVARFARPILLVRAVGET